MTITRKSPLARSPMPRSSRPVGILGQASHAKIRARKCAQCRQAFEPARPTAKTCGAACAELFAAAIRVKVERKADKARKQALKSRADWLKEAQAAVNAFIRWRDRLLPCVSCGRSHQGQWHAGHFLGVGAHPALRYSELNIAKQCQPCNVQLSGNALNFRKGLIVRVGVEVVEWLEGPHEPAKYTIEQAKEIRDGYRLKLREAMA